jgi:phosphohistidine phosphatase SixA
MTSEAHNIDTILTDPATIIFIRDGGGSRHADDQSLCEAGVQQARRTARYLRSVLGHASMTIAASSAGTALHTAETLASTLEADRTRLKRPIHELGNDCVDATDGNAEKNLEVALQKIGAHHATALSEGARLVIVAHSELLASVAESLSPWRNGAGEHDDEDGYPQHEPVHITAVHAGVVRAWNIPPVVQQSH